MFRYYDAILALIPLAMLAVAGGLAAAGVSTTVAVPVGALFSVGLIGHALFVNAPVDAASGADGTSPPGFEAE